MKKTWSITLLLSLLVASNIALADGKSKQPNNDEGPGTVIIDPVTGKVISSPSDKPPINDEGPGKGGKKK